MYKKLASLIKAFDMVFASRNNFRHKVAEFSDCPLLGKRGVSSSAVSFVICLRLWWRCAFSPGPVINISLARAISMQAPLVRASALEFRHFLAALMAIARSPGPLTNANSNGVQLARGHAWWRKNGSKPHPLALSQHAHPLCGSMGMPHVTMFWESMQRKAEGSHVSL